MLAVLEVQGAPEQLRELERVRLRVGAPRVAEVAAPESARGVRVLPADRVPANVARTAAAFDSMEAERATQEVDVRSVPPACARHCPPSPSC